MSRDHRKLHVFAIADELVLQIYRVSSEFASAERFGIQGQLRRAAVSAASNIVEGSARRSTREYCHFLNVASGSASEARYLVELAGRLGVAPQEAVAPLVARYDELCARLQALINALSREP